MKLFIYADPHWSSYSSIIRSRGQKYSTRLENLIKTINWVEESAVMLNCDAVVCLGDFFDKAELNSEELTALREILWNDLPHHFIVGNHEMGRHNLQYSSSHLFELCPNACVSDVVGIIRDSRGTQICLLPYVLESDRMPLSSYLPPTDGDRIILSHNDIKGLQMGKFISQDGFTIEEIKENCRLFINGHLHNGTELGNIINLGNITGQNFSEDSSKYRHNALLLDTENFSVSSLENPYAFNFYKLDFTPYTKDDVEVIRTVLSKTIGPNAVCSIHVREDTKFIVEDILSICHNIVECRVILDMSFRDSSGENLADIRAEKLDHLSKFAEYVRTNIAGTELIEEELMRILV